MPDKLISDVARREIVAAYQRGDKIQEIQQRHNVPRATIYWVLEQAQVTPDRVKRGRRLVGDDQQLAQLYDLIQAQDARIRELEARLGESS